MKITEHKIIKIEVDEQELYIEIDALPTLIEELQRIHLREIGDIHISPITISPPVSPPYPGIPTTTTFPPIGTTDDGWRSGSVSSTASAGDTTIAWEAAKMYAATAREDEDVYIKVERDYAERG